VRGKNGLDEHTTVEIQIATYREIALVAKDEESLDFIKGRIAELEQKLRQLDH
jgi:hypothetical protein